MLFRIIILLLTLLLLPDVYIYWMYVRRWTTSRWLRLLSWLPLVALLGAMGYLMTSNDMKPENQPLVGIFMVVFMTICIPKFLFAFFDSIGHLFKSVAVKRCFRIFAMSLSLFAVIILVYGHLLGRKRFVIHNQTFYFADLPAQFDGYRIAQFSDMHIGSFRMGHEGDVEKIVDLINSQHCNLIAFTGDLVNHKASELDGFEGALRRLSAPDGVFSIMGNHDYSMYMRYTSEKERRADVLDLQRRQRSYGWKLLLNDNVVLRRGNDSIAIIGVENDGRPPFPSLGDLPKATKGLNKNTFSVLLSHDPTHWRREVLPKTRIQLMLSGHTHSGQFKVFGWSPVKNVYDEWTGAYSEGAQILNVSDGIGAVMFPFRFGAWPEVNVITLKRGAPVGTKTYTRKQ